MSYLSSLRLHFAGEFQANVSTVNNDPAHFHNATFKDSYQTLQGPRMNPPNGWFNPEGDASFRLLGCAITAAWTTAGPADPQDPVLACIVADSDGAVPAKLVDLDPEQQLVSEIWGLEVRIADGDGNTLLRGRYVPAAFTDIWDRASGGGSGDMAAGAAYQSVLEDLQWSEGIERSPFLVALRQASQASGRLSIKFNLDGLNADFRSPRFMCGRIVGTIGPAAPGEPCHLVVGRHFLAVAMAGGNFFTPVGGLNHFPAVIEPETGRLIADLGNALSTATPGGAINNVGDLKLAVFDPSRPRSDPGAVVPLGTLAPATGSTGYAQKPGWYARTAGIVVLPLGEVQRRWMEHAPLAVTGNATIEIAEAPNGTYLRADTYVYRMSPGESVEIPIRAMQWGRPLAGAAVSVVPDKSQLQPTNAEPPYVEAGPPVATPDDALAYGPLPRTDADGLTALPLTGRDPGTPRWFNDGRDYGIDGQVYGIRPSFADPALAVPGPQVNQWNFISVLLWSGFEAPEPVTWTTVQPIFQQYANLYPVMLRFLNLADPEQLRENLPLLTLAFSLPVSDPNTMPVTRDLSPAKRRAILAWLANPLPGDATAPAALAASPASDPRPPVGPGANNPAAKGGKAAAAARRLIVQARNGAQS